MNETDGVEAVNATSVTEPSTSGSTSATDDNNTTNVENDSNKTIEDEEIPLSSEVTKSSQANGARGGAVVITNSFMFFTYCVAALSTVYLLACG